MALTRSAILYEQAYNEDDRLMKCQTEETYQEDKAFFNKMKKKRPEDMNRSEIQRMFRMTERYMQTYFNLDKAIGQVRDEQVRAEEIGTNLDGFRIGYIHKKTLELLDYIKGGV